MAISLPPFILHSLFIFYYLSIAAFRTLSNLAKVFQTPSDILIG